MAQQHGRTVQVKKVPTASAKLDSERLLAELCYFYPQYSLFHARRLPAKDVILLLKVARAKSAEKYLNLTQIVAAPHDKGGTAVSSLISKYKRESQGEW